MSTGYQPIKQQSSFKPETSASLAAPFLSNPKHLFPKEHDGTSRTRHPVQVRNIGIARVPIWVHMIVNSFCYVPATPREHHHPPKSSCPLKSPKPSLWSRRHSVYGGILACCVFWKEGYQRTYLMEGALLWSWLVMVQTVLWYPDEKDDRNANHWHWMGKKNTGDLSAVLGGGG